MIRSALPTERPRVEALLAASKLPIAGVEEHFSSFLVAEEGGAIVGAAGLEIYASSALLRSVVVAEDARGAGLGSVLTQHALAAAASRGVHAVYLLTTTAETFFPRFGFVQVAREDVPALLHASEELRGACPASAVAMRLRLEGSDAARSPR